MKYLYSAIALIAVAVIYHFNFNIISQNKDQESLNYSETNQESNTNKNSIIKENLKPTVLKNKVTNSTVKNEDINKTNPIVDNAKKNQQQQIVEEKIASTIKKIDYKNDLFNSLAQKHRVTNEPIMEGGNIYFPVYKDQKLSHFNEITQETANAILSEPDNFIEIVVNDFVDDNAEHGDWDNNWGNFESNSVQVNFQYCKNSTCLIRGSHQSMQNAIEDVEAYKSQNPNLYIEEYIFTNGSFLLKYSKT